MIKEDILIIDRLKSTCIGNLYINHLKKNHTIRNIVITTWPIFFRFYAKHKLKLSYLKYRMLTLSTFIESKNINKKIIFARQNVKTAIPRVFPETDTKHVKSSHLPPHDSYDFPDIYLSEIKNAVVHGGTNLIKCDDQIIAHDLYNFDTDSTSEEFHGKNAINRKSNTIKSILFNNITREVEIAASFLDALASNYAHFITEILPRIAIFAQMQEYKEVPILINANLHPNILNAIAIVSGNDRKIIFVENSVSIAVKHLIVISPTGYVQFERINKKSLNNCHGLFSPQAFAELKKQIIQNSPPANKEYPKKIYLRRRNAARSIENNYELEEHLIAGGFRVLEPDLIDFLEQTRIFANADIIVAPSGAALANIIFCRPQTKIIILMPRYRHTNYWYWQNMAKAAGCEVTYILGQEKSKTIHSSFSVNIDDILNIVAKHFDLLKYSDYLSENKIKSQFICEAFLVKTSIPKTFSEQDNEYVVCAHNLPHDIYDAPPVYTAEIKAAKVVGGCNLTKVQDKIIAHDLYNFRTDLTSEELHLKNTIYPDKMRIRTYLFDNSDKEIEIAASFLDALATNYAHFLTELLPRITLFCNQEKFKDVPLLINSGLHQNLLRAIALVVGENRQIIQVASGEVISVGKLILVSPSGYVPFERRHKEMIYINNGVFNPVAFEALKEKIFTALATNQETKSPHILPKKIYLSRKKGMRSIINNEELEKYLNLQGFVTILGDSLTFDEQVNLFSQAEFIIGPSGAACANLIFCPPTCKILILMPRNKHILYWYWQNIAKACKNKVSYLLGCEESPQPHSEFMIDLKNLKNALENL